ncbi:SAM-dependent methyltransferase [Streptomyces sp. NBC_01481]|uniref:THUMP-like domain-containing protein n=1 Tax=Streptomyces sp. NBC_01481 TaxID=2975869 RepID=UPI0022535D4E|nr:SAM-dependent methyltransferase [Streptomyces sp. NBC_01481]MCX4582377.1 SAM-dependent methyltransferase [Streptomyces sp. NBC_01481]
MDLEAFKALLTDEGQALLASLSDFDPADELATAARLRREYPAELVSAAIEQIRLRQQAVAKFGADAHRMYFTPDGLEQSSHKAVAEYRAKRLYQYIGTFGVETLGCGIGGDAIEVADTGLVVWAVDHDPLACAVAAANADALELPLILMTVTCEDDVLESVGFGETVVIDLVRRVDQDRNVDPEAYSTHLSRAVETVREATAGGAIKIAPDIPHEVLPDCALAEWISYDGDVQEAVLWFDWPDGTGFGGLHGVRSATLLPGGESLISRGLPDPAVRPVGRYLYEPDGAVIHAHLVAELAQDVDGGLIDETIAYITADDLHATPFATAYEITDVMPFSTEVLSALLCERGIGELTVKERGSAADPEELCCIVKPHGPNAATVFVTGTAGSPTMLLGHRLHSR